MLRTETLNSHIPHLSTMLQMFNLHNAMTFNIDYEQSVQKIKWSGVEGGSNCNTDDNFILRL